MKLLFALAYTLYFLLYEEDDNMQMLRADHYRPDECLPNGKRRV